jgi:cell division protein FtsZ
MKNGGVAILGAAAKAGDNRALKAVEEALNSPLLNDNDIRGAKWLLLNITSAAGEYEHTMDETEAIQAYVQQMAGDHCDVILGMGHDPNLDDKIAVTVIATGFNHKEIVADLPVKKNEPEKIIVTLGSNNTNAALNNPVSQSGTPIATQIAKPVDPMAPTLVEMPISAHKFTLDVKPQPSLEKEEFEIFTLDMSDNQGTLENDIKIQEPEQKQEDTSSMRLVIKEEENLTEKTEIKIGSHVLTQDEIDEKRRFEEQKRLLEERAERLRRMSFDIKNTDAGEEMEAVPAYVRQKVQLDNEVASSDTFYSGYSVGVNDKQNDNRASIQTINTFLDGKKPD